ncbi:MAG TPA: hypothetical protein VK766_06155 [Cytophagaceae bacterium]|jgi:hypothetical protein|nr:hypothetical protein [Cytophagaceae bacterium]
MKNFIVIMTVLLLSLTVFSSCKKAYECSCQNGQVVNPYMDKMTKSEAATTKTLCESNAGCTFQPFKK